MPVRTTVPRACSAVLPPPAYTKDRTTLPRTCSAPFSTCWRLPATNRTTVQRTCFTVIPRLAHAEDRTTVPRPQSRDHSPKTTVPRPQSRDRDHSPKTTVPRPQSRDHSPKTTVPRPQSPEHVLQFCPLQHILKTTRQDHSPQNMFCSSTPTSERQQRGSGPLEPRCQESNQRPFDHESDALTTELT